MTFIIEKDKWAEIINWCFEKFEDNSWRFKDGKKLRIIFKDKKSATLFALKWGSKV
jgi:hypothetical protein